MNTDPTGLGEILQEIDVHAAHHAEAEDGYATAVLNVLSLIDTVASDGFFKQRLIDQGVEEAGGVTQAELDAATTENRASLLANIDSAIGKKRDSLLASHYEEQARKKLLLDSTSAEEPRHEQ